MINIPTTYPPYSDYSGISIGIDPIVTQVTYKVKTVQKVLTEIAGLLVLTRILTLILRLFNEWSFNRKMTKKNNEDIREVFTYSNFKKAIVKIQEIETENQQIKTKNQEIETENQDIKAEN